MTPTLSLDALSPLLVSSIMFLAWAMLGLAVYSVLFDRAAFEEKGKVWSAGFGVVDLFGAGALSVLFATVAIAGFTQTAPAASVAKLPSGNAMIAGVILSSLLEAALLGGIVGSLVWRRLPWREVFGLGRLPFFGVFGRALLLLPLAVPLITAAIVLTRVLLTATGHPEEGSQEIVRFLAAPGTGPARVVVAFSAVLVAPLMEELLFRGYIHGVARRYLGVAGGLALNALLFAGIHLHAPSFGGLFVLAACLTLAYEWSGSIFVPITMHALFNTISVVNLFHGGNV